VTCRKVGEGIGQPKKQSEHSRHESDEYSNQWNRADRSALGDALGQSREETKGRGKKKNETNCASPKVTEGRGMSKKLEDP
jgi:hypothetical protein